MKRILFILLIVAADAFCELPILNTPFRKDSLETVQTHALHNNPDAQVELALRYYAGHQVSANSATAFEWMQKAAGQENVNAQFLLSRMMAEGIGTQVDAKASNVWFAKAIAANPDDKMLVAQYDASLAAKENDSEARNEFLQICSDAGYAPAFVALREPEAVALFSKGKTREALAIFQRLADRNSPAGFYRLAQMVANGQGGLPEDHVKALDLYRKAAEAGHPEAQVELAGMIEAGVGVDEDPDEAAKWYEKSAQNGCAEAQYKVAEMKFSSAIRWFEQASLNVDDGVARFESMKKYKRDLSRSVEWYRKAADGNIPAAQYMLGRLHASGEGVVRTVDESLQYHQQAAEQGYAESLFYIGLMYHAGSGLPKDVSKAVFFYQKAAERGSLAALFYLGNCYSFGEGVEQSPKKGEEFYRKVLESATAGENVELRGNVWALRAAREVAIILWRKAGSEEDLSEARTWMSFVARSGDPAAREMLIQMTTGERDEEGDVLIASRAADPRSDAVAKRRDSVFLYPYVLMDIKEIYPEFNSPQIIAYATPRGEVRGITGERLWELSMKYKRPSVRASIGLNGVLLMGVELEDKETGEVSWAFNEAKEMDVVFSGETFIDVSLFVDISGNPDARIRNWTVLYAHRLGHDRSVLAVLDHKEKAKSTGSLDEMASRNRFSRKLDSTVMSTLDINANFPGDVPDPDGESSDEDDDSSIFDSIFGG